MAGPKWWASKGAYFAYINGARVRLGSDLLDAQRRFYELSLAGLATAQHEPTVAEVFASYLARLTLRNRPKTTKCVTELMKPFVKTFGALTAREITEARLTPWLASQTGWGPGTRGLVTGYIRTAWRRAGLPPPDFGRQEHGQPRGDDCLISDEQHADLLRIAHPVFRDFLIALDETGARPGAIRTVRVDELQRDTWVLPPEPGRKVKKKLVVLLSETMIALCARLAAQTPTGPLFRDKRGRPWIERTLRTHWDYYKAKLGLPRPIVMYSYRHRFATRWLLNGGSPAYLATVQGTSLPMIQRYYGHMLSDLNALRQEHARVQSRGHVE